MLLFRGIVYIRSFFIGEGKMKVGLLKNFLHYFNLKQGTVLIAVFQLVNRARLTNRYLMKDPGIIGTYPLNLLLSFVQRSSPLGSV